MSLLGRGGLTALHKQAHPDAAHLHQLLPYRYFNDDLGLFDNHQSLGFGKHLSLLGGANNELIMALNDVVMRLPEGDKWDYQFVMTGNNQVGHIIDKNLKEASVRGGMVETIAQHQAIYAHYAAENGYNTRLGEAYRFDLKNYQAQFYCTSTASEEAVSHLKDTLDYAFVQAGLDHQPMGPTDIIDQVGQVLNFNSQRTTPRHPHYNPDEYLHSQMLELDSEFLIHRDYVESRCTFEHQTAPAHTRIVNFTLRKLPAEFRLYAFSNCLASLRNAANALRCPFRISCNFRIEPTGKQKVANENKIRSLTKTVNSPMAMFTPTAKKELEERKHLQEAFLRDECKIARMVFTLTLFTTSTRMKGDVASALSVFSEAGLPMIEANMIQGQTLLASLPFNMLSFFNDCKIAGRVRTIKTTNLINFFPIVGEYKRIMGGMLLPTMRHQISYFNPFDMNTDNYNMAITGVSGSGKSFLTQNIAHSVFARGGKVWILDKGDSYKKFTQTMNGVYMTSGQIFLNPFTHIKTMENAVGTAFKDAKHLTADTTQTEHPLTLILDDITGLIAAMAAPNTDLDDTLDMALSDAILLAWDRHQQATLIDHVQEALFELSVHRDNDRRIKDLGHQLNKYCTTGIYGDIFNQPSQLDPDAHLTTIELDGFSDNVLRPVIFALIVSINQAMYLAGGRSLPKVCIIEEAWKLMSGSNRQSRAFIDKGYRTARKFGGSFATVTQGISDFFQSDESQAAYNNSDIKIILRQGSDFDKFVKANPDAFYPHHVRLIKRFPTAKEAGFSCAMIQAGVTITFHRLFVDPWSIALYSTDPKEYEFCEQLTQQGTPLLAAIEQTAWHFYPDNMATFEAIKAQYSKEPRHDE
ncbi:type IV secretion system protein TraC [Photobacterium leiognathi]|uniref:Type IV secretion system protein TraC n=2 Tax=Photobacterium leiognathi TaxID=553611 RepID=A0A2T3M7H7_PHOLE|nr:type IV secretion system protein TraC [Photobacterium leiognathi]PSV88235.1 type IV secretion system protein TraC [Photobacterium leiognathi]